MIPSGPAICFRTVLVAGVPTVVGLFAADGVEVDEKPEVWFAGNAFSKQAKAFLGKVSHAISLTPDGCVTAEQNAAIFEPLSLAVGNPMFADNPFTILSINTGHQRTYLNAAVRKVSDITCSTQSGGMPFGGMTLLALPVSTAAGIGDAGSLYVDKPGVANPGVYNTYTTPFAATTLTGNIGAVAPSNNDSFGLGGMVYVYKTVLTGATGEILINGVDGSLVNAARCINQSGGTPGTDYAVGIKNPLAVASATVTAHAIPITAFWPGLPGNNVATSIITGTTQSFTGATMAGATGVFTGSMAKLQSTMRADLFTWAYKDQSGTPVPGFAGFTAMEGAKVSLSFGADMIPSGRLGYKNALYGDLTASVTMTPDDSATFSGPTLDQVDAALMQQGSGAGIGFALTRPGYTLVGTAPTGGLKISLFNAGLQDSKRVYVKGKQRQGPVTFVTGTDIAAGVMVAPVAISIAS